MVFRNALICDEDFKLVKSDLEINGEIIASVGESGKDGIDCAGKVILPGFIDIHIHGCNGADCTDGKPDSAEKMSGYLASVGVTSFCPTTMTLPAERLKESFKYINETAGREPGARIAGINAEGPFISPSRKGAQDERNILPPDIELFNELNNISKIKLIDIAPEINGADEFIRRVSRVCTVSAAHTDADYDTAMNAFKNGITHCTHLFNAMRGLGSREPGLVGAVFDSDKVTAELICDGVHISAATLRIAFRQLGYDRTVVISDSTMAAGLPDGDYCLGGQAVVKKNGAVRLPDGTLAGSSANLFEEFKNLLSFGIPGEQAIRSVTINPARVIGEDKSTGSISPGKKADFIIVDKSFSAVECTYVGGKRVF